jgi:hypothetical protein
MVSGCGCFMGMVGRYLRDGSVRAVFRNLQGAARYLNAAFAFDLRLAVDPRRAALFHHI